MAEKLENGFFCLHEMLRIQISHKFVDVRCYEDNWPALSLVVMVFYAASTTQSDLSSKLFVHPNHGSAASQYIKGIIHRSSVRTV
jgi:hypothetical protein